MPVLGLMGPLRCSPCTAGRLHFPLRIPSHTAASVRTTSPHPALNPAPSSARGAQRNLPPCLQYSPETQPDSLLHNATPSFPELWPCHHRPRAAILHLATHATHWIPAG